jgi:hypothetical protein
MPFGYLTSAARYRAVSKAGEEVAVRLAGHTEEAIETVVRLRGPAIAADVEIERLRHPQLAARELAQEIVLQKTRLVAATGALSALPGVAPGGGTALEIGLALADAITLIYNEVTAIVAIAAAYGRDLDDVESRRLDVLLSFALHAGVAVPAGKTLEVMGERVALDAPPADLVAHVNRNVGGEVIRHLARRRARAFLGREIPFGVGVAIGAGFNYSSMRRIGRSAIRYFEL